MGGKLVKVMSGSIYDRNTLFEMKIFYDLQILFLLEIKLKNIYPIFFWIFP